MEKPIPGGDIHQRVIFTKTNWILFFLGLGLLLLGYIVMSLDGTEYGFGPLGLTIGPLILAAGFAVEFFAIMYRDKKPAEKH